MYLWCAALPVYEGLPETLAAAEETVADPGNPSDLFVLYKLSIVNVCLMGQEFSKREFVSDLVIPQFSGAKVSAAWNAAGSAAPQLC